MDDISGSAEVIDVDRIHLDIENPRHDPRDSQDDVIAVLCQKELVQPLARDIAKHGLSPLDLFALVPIEAGRKTSYVVVEGNRRLCALKLLNDPDLAPPDLRSTFEKLAEGWTPIAQVSAVVFDARDDVRLWIERAHGGTQGGIGRKAWDAEQKQRFSGDKKNFAAQQLLDYAEEKNFITAKERDRKLTTVSRYVSNPHLRESLGLDISTPEEVCRDRPGEDFDLMVHQFMRDLVEGDVHSRTKSDDIVQYARALQKLEGVGQDRVEPQPLQSSKADVRLPGKKGKPKKPRGPRKLHYDSERDAALQAISNAKLQELHYSLCSVDLSKHTMLVAVGLWSFLESLTSLSGRHENTSFVAYLSKQKLASLKCGSADDIKAMVQAIKRVSEAGNTTKHHRIAAALNGKQLENDARVLGPALIALARDCKK